MSVRTRVETRHGTRGPCRSPGHRRRMAARTPAGTHFTRRRGARSRTICGHPGGECGAGCGAQERKAANGEWGMGMNSNRCSPVPPADISPCPSVDWLVKAAWLACALRQDFFTKARVEPVSRTRWHSVVPGGTAAGRRPLSQRSTLGSCWSSLTVWCDSTDPNAGHDELGNRDLLLGFLEWMRVSIS